MLNLNEQKIIAFDFDFPKGSKIEFWFEDLGLPYRETNEFTVPSDEYGKLLKNAKKYMPTITVTRDPKTIAGELIVNMPQDEKALKEAIEKAKEPFYKEEGAKISKEVSKSVPQLPCGAQGAGGIPGIIGGYAVELEE